MKNDSNYELVQFLSSLAEWALVIVALVMIVLILVFITARAQAQLLKGCENLPVVGQNSDVFYRNAGGVFACLETVNGIQAALDYFMQAEICREGDVWTQARAIHDYMNKLPGALDENIVLGAFACQGKKSTYTPWTGSALNTNCTSDGGCGGYISGFIISWWDLKYDLKAERQEIINKLNSVCSPEHFTPGQALKITMKYMDQNPEQLNLPAPELIYRAMRQAFPCNDVLR